MKWTLLLLVGAILAVWVAIYAARRIARGDRRFVALGRLAWSTFTLLLLLLGVYAAHLAGLFTVPLVAIAFLVVAVPVRIALRSRNRQR